MKIKQAIPNSVIKRRKIGKYIVSACIGPIVGGFLYLGIFSDYNVKHIDKVYCVEYNLSDKMSIYGLRNVEDFVNGFLKKYGIDEWQIVIRDIIEISEHFNVHPGYFLAICDAEKGDIGKECGILPTQAYERDEGFWKSEKFIPYVSLPNPSLFKQFVWLASTLKRNFERYENGNYKEDFIDFLAKRFAPIGADNDPYNLNIYWEDNVRDRLKHYIGKENYEVLRWDITIP